MTSHALASADLHTHAKFSVQFKPRVGKPLEERTLILTSYCFHAQFNQGLPPKTIVRTEFTIPFIEISTLENFNRDEIAFGLTDQRHLTFVASHADISAIISHIMMSMTNHFPEIDVEDRLITLKMSDADRLTAVRNAVRTRRARIEAGPCGSFRETYDYFCKYFNSPKREEIVWDIETVYHSQSNKTLTLRDFDHVDSKDLLPVIASISFSSWFNALDASGIRLSPEAQLQVLNVLKRNKQLNSLVLDNCSLKRSDFCGKMPGFVESTGCNLRHLDLSNNPVGDSGVVALSGLFTKLRLSLERLILANCGLSARSANRVAEAFTGSIRDVKSPLAQLNLSGNSLKSEELSQFFNFLANQNSLTSLDLTKTDCVIDSLSVGLSRGCTQHLRVLRISGNPFFANRKGSMVNDAWRQFFATTIALEELYLASCRLPLEALRGLLTGLSQNCALSGLLLDLSSNELRTGGAADLLLESLPKLQMLSSLDLSDNDLNSDLLKVIEALTSAQHIKHLKIGANYGSLKNKQVIDVMEKLAQLIQSPLSSIESLSLADSKLRGDITILLNELSSNPSLVALDISGNQMGDVGLRILSRILVLNTHLRELAWDRNCLSLQSLEEVAKALEHNHTLQFLKLPLLDLGPLMQRNPERTTALIAKIEATLAKNHGLRKLNKERAFKLHQGFASSSSHQNIGSQPHGASSAVPSLLLIDKLIVQLDSRSSRLLNANPEDLSEEAKAAVNDARAVVNDAQAAKRLLSSLQTDAVSLEEGRDTPVARGLAQVPGQLQSVMTEQIRLSVEKMIGVAKDQCGFIARDEALCESLKNECVTKCQLGPRFLDTLVQSTLSTGLANKVAELDLIAASLISDRVLDEAIRQLDRQHRVVHRFAANVVTLRRRRKLATESVSSIGSNNAFEEGENRNSRVKRMAESASHACSKLKATPEEDNVLPELEHIDKSPSSRVCRPRSTFAVAEAVSDEEGSDADDAKPDDLKENQKVEAVKELEKTSLVAEEKDEKVAKAEEEEVEEKVANVEKKEEKEEKKEEEKEKVAREEEKEEEKERVPKEEETEEKELAKEKKLEAKEEIKEKRKSLKGRAPSPPSTAPPSLLTSRPPSVKKELPSPTSTSPQRPQSLHDDLARRTSDRHSKGSLSSATSGATSTEDLLAGSPTRHSPARPSSTTQSAASKSQDSLDSIGMLSPFSETPSASPSTSHRLLTHPQRARPKRPRQHRPTKANVTGDTVMQTLFSPDALELEDEKDEEEESIGAVGTEKKEETKEAEASDKNIMKSMFKHLPSKDKHRKSPNKREPSPSAEPVEKAEPSPPPPEEEPAAAAPATTPARLPPRTGPAMPAFSLADIKKRREDLRKDAPQQPSPTLPSPMAAQPPNEKRASIANWIQQGKPDTPSSPKPKPSHVLPTLRPVALREKDPKSAAMTEEVKEKRLSVRERAATFAPNASPPAPPPKPRKPTSLRGTNDGAKPPPPQKPQE